ncbi:MAG: preprotein translocase subunit SecF [Gammaproteobacteria bacterium]|jgi:preprotein translocase subunit SecF|nr:preprotein translocase subunit SecF [Gammaproteobacteria bacterium]
MEFFKQKTNIDFLGIRKWSWLLSALLIIASFVSLGVRGINWGLDFTGGYSIQVHYQNQPNLDQVHSQLAQAGLSHVDVVTFGSTKDLMLSLSPSQDMQNQIVSAQGQSEQEQLASQVQSALGSSVQIVAVNYTGPEVGAELAQRGMLAMLIAVLAIMAYIALRFEMRFAVSAAIALAHDPIIIMGIFSVFQLKFDLTALAAVLAVIGYSLNDTVVVYDRIRENFRKMRKAGVEEVVNRAINDTLSRTIMTSGLTFIVVTVLFLLGGPSIHYFSLALMIGVIVGTYSSIYIAGALAVLFGLNRQALVPSPKQVDDRP